MSSDIRALGEDLRRLLESLTDFTPDEVREVEQFLRAGEYGVAFETLCGIIKEEGILISDLARPAIRALAQRMEIDPEWWAEICQVKTKDIR